MDESLKLIEAPEVTLANRYNARMQRVRREEDGVASLLVYDAQKLVAEAGAGVNGEVERYYLAEGGSVYSPLVSQLGSQHCAQKHSWFLFDALGTTLGLAGDSGSLSDTFVYEAFGTSLGRTGTTATPYQYVGGYGYFREAGVGLEQVWWRWRDPGIANWGSRDRLSSGAQRRPLPPYLYVESGPTMGRDPSGLGGMGWMDGAFIFKCTVPLPPLSLAEDWARCALLHAGWCAACWLACEAYCEWAEFGEPYQVKGCIEACRVRTTACVLGGYSF